MTGIQIWGDSGFLQIDQGYRNYAMTNAFAGTTSRGIGNNGTSVVDYAIAAEPLPICAFRNVLNDGPWVVPHVLAFYPPNPSIRTLPMHVNGGVGSHAEAYFFDLPPQSGNLNGLVQLVNESGQVAFDSDFLYLRVLDQLTLSTGQVGEMSRFYSGRKVACAISKPGRLYTYEDNGTHIYEYQHVLAYRQNTDGVCRIQWLIYRFSIVYTYSQGGELRDDGGFELNDFNPPPTFTNGGEPAEFFLIDVTNHPIYYDYLGYVDAGVSL